MFLAPSARWEDGGRTQPRGQLTPQKRSQYSPKVFQGGIHWASLRYGRGLLQLLLADKRTQRGPNRLPDAAVAGVVALYTWQAMDHGCARDCLLGVDCVWFGSAPPRPLKAGILAVTGRPVGWNDPRPPRRTRPASRRKRSGIPENVVPREYNAAVEQNAVR